MKVLVAILLVSVVRCLPRALDQNVREKIDSLPFLLKDSVNTFNSKLFKSLTTSEAGNIIYSPFSLHMLLSQAYVGAPKETPTSEELAKLLGFEPSEANNQAYLYNYLKVIDHLEQVSGKKGAEVSIANKLFAADDLKINEFVNDKTNGLISKILESDALDGLSRLVLINAVYFKGLWKDQFKAEDTKTEPFHVDSNRKVDILSICRL